MLLAFQQCTGHLPKPHSRAGRASVGPGLRWLPGSPAQCHELPGVRSLQAPPSYTSRNGSVPVLTAGYPGNFTFSGGKPITASFLEGSGMELPAQTTIPGTAPSSPSPGLESPLAGALPAASSQLAVAGPAAPEGLPQGPEELLPDVSVKASPGCPPPTGFSEGFGAHRPW